MRVLVLWDPGVVSSILECEETRPCFEVAPPPQKWLEAPRTPEIQTIAGCEESRPGCEVARRPPWQRSRPEHNTAGGPLLAVFGVWGLGFRVGGRGAVSRG